MKKKLAVLLILILCLGLVGCGGGEGDDAQVLSPAADTEQTTDAEETDETASADDTGSNEEKLNAAADGETDTATGTASTEPADGGNSETDGESDEPSLPECEVTELDEPVVMYASDSLNVRQGPSTDYEIVGFLKSGRDVTVIGQADTGWYEILYNEEKVFVSNKYLQSEKPIEEEEPVLQASTDAEPAADNQPQEPEAVKPVTEVKNVAGVIFVGDSRFVQMKSSVGDNPCTWIAESSKGYKWLNENAIARIDNCVGKGSKVLINLGVNDPGNIQNYLTLVNAKAEEWTSKGATVYYASVNPVWDNPYVTEEQVKIFNSQLQGGLSGNIHYIDSHSYLESIGYKLVDGLHYSTETNQNLYAYYMSCM